MTRRNTIVPADLRKFCEFGGMACPVSNLSRKDVMNIREIQLSKRGSVWWCTVYLSITTSEQFTDQPHHAYASGLWWFTAMFRSYMAARRLNRKLRAKPGEREAKGWE